MEKKDNKNFWSRWAVRYDKTMSGSEKLYQNITSHMQKTLKRDMTVLELACGTGLLSVKIAPIVKHLEATDFSAEMIKQAKMKSYSAKLHFSVQDMFRLPYADKSFDVVIVSNTIIDTSSAFNENSSACLSFIRCDCAL